MIRFAKTCLLSSVFLLSAVIAQGEGAGDASAGLGGVSQTFNPDISVIIDGYFHCDDSEEGLGHLLSKIAGFSHVHVGEEHHHHGPDQGFNLNHLELALSGEIDPFVKGRAIAAVTAEGAELEEAVVETTALSNGFGIKFGKFFSDFGRINAQHSHDWDFTEAPLVHLLMLGAHGLNDIGLQASWLAPTSSYLLLGIEAFQGSNEATFPYIGEDPLPEHTGPRVGAAWVKWAPNLRNPHGLQLGASYGFGIRQEAHDGNSDGTLDHWLDGDAAFWGVDLVYKLNRPTAYGVGDLTVQMEYLRRDMDVEVVRHDLNPLLVGEHKVDAQDGCYVQVTYGFAPRLRLGLRWDLVGLTNRTELPDGTVEEHDPTNRVSLMLDFSPSEFSRMRLGTSYGNYVTATDEEEVWAVTLQWQASLGQHGAHKF